MAASPGAFAIAQVAPDRSPPGTSKESAALARQGNKGTLKKILGNGAWGFFRPDDGSRDLHFSTNEFIGAKPTAADIGRCVEWEGIRLNDDGSPPHAIRPRFAGDPKSGVASHDAAATRVPPGGPHREERRPPAPSRGRATGRRGVSGWHERRLLGHALVDWADFPGGLNKAVARLADLALDEDWWFGGLRYIGKPLPILYNYLTYTFAKLLTEHESKVADKLCMVEDLAAFNTGLVNEEYNDLYAVFTRYSEDDKWLFKDFCTRHEGGLSDRFCRVIVDAPRRASYFDKTADLIYTWPADRFPEIKWVHVIRDAIANDRYPIDFLRSHCPKDFEIHDPRTLSNIRPGPGAKSAREAYLERLAEAVWADHDGVQAAIENKLRKSLKRVSWNFKTAIPMWYPTFNIMGLLLPLALTKDGDGKDHIDLALVVEKITKDGKRSYRGQTVLSLDQAYKAARLVCRPDSDWLRPDLIRLGGGEAEHAHEENEAGDVRPASAPAQPRLAIGSVHTLRVAAVKPFGVFVEIEPDVNGLCRISEYDLDYTEEEALLREVKVGGKLRVKVKGIEDGGKYVLSRALVIEDEGLPRVRQAECEDEAAPGGLPKQGAE
jgi:predicted RNA-binding protein with RPS1 domain